MEYNEENLVEEVQTEEVDYARMLLDRKSGKELDISRCNVSDEVDIITKSDSGQNSQR